MAHREKRHWPKRKTAPRVQDVIHRRLKTVTIRSGTTHNQWWVHETGEAKTEPSPSATRASSWHPASNCRLATDAPKNMANAESVITTVLGGVTS